MAFATSAASRYLPLVEYPYPLIAYYTGLFLVALGAVVALSAAFSFVRKSTTLSPLAPESASKLVVSGLFRYSRNPMYLGMLLCLVGWAVLHATLTGFVPVVLFVAVMTYWQIIPEEKCLEKLFTDDYLNYKKRVRRWF